MSAEELKEYIRNHSEEEIYSKFLLGQDVWYFIQNVQDEDPLLFYDKFKRFISSHLNVHFNNISIVGTAKTKYSFAPKKKFREFTAESDFDIVLVSSNLYQNFWTSFYRISQEQYVPDYGRVTSNIFRKFISIRELDPNYNDPILLDWQRKLSEFRTQLQLDFKIYSEINFRIYDSWEAMEGYHLQGIKTLKTKVNETN